MTPQQPQELDSGKPELVCQCPEFIADHHRPGEIRRCARCGLPTKSGLVRSELRDLPGVNSKDFRPTVYAYEDDLVQFIAQKVDEAKADVDRAVANKNRDCMTPKDDEQWYA